MARLSYRIALLLGLGWGAEYVLATPAPQASTTTAAAPSGSANPCGQIAAATVSFKSQNPSVATPTVTAQLALACLQSVPNKPEPASRLISSLKAFAQWQSTLAWLKAPPASYMLPPVDIMEGLDNISSTAVAGRFGSEYEFQGAIVELLAAAHDGHFSFRPDVFKAFGFRNNLTIDLVSVSLDGLAVPKLYHLADLTNTRNGTNGTAMPPAITMINGRPAAQVISELALKFSGYQDPDSQWNSQFSTYAFPNALSFLSGVLVQQFPSITLTYDNGQTKSQDNFAIIRPGADFNGITNGEDFYNRFCNPDAPAATTTAAATPAPSRAAAPAPTIAGYPFPVVRDNGANITAGYFLNGTGYEDVAVLSISGFSPASATGADGATYLPNLQTTVETFLAKCKQAGKKRLVIDVTANGGGFVVAGYEVFSQLFPDAPMFEAHNLRLTDSLSDLARLTNALDQGTIVEAINGTTEQQQAISVLANSEVLSNLLPGGVYTPAGTNFTSVDEILSPVTLQGDRFTAFQQTPLNQTSADFNLTGTGTRSNPPPAVFAPENVVLLTDGTCGSTCTLFAYLLIAQRNVKTVTVGGRPQKGPMQAIAGVEGAQVFPMSSISNAAAAVISLSDSVKQGEVNGSDLAVLAEGYAVRRSTTGSVNGKNAFSPNDAHTPLQFLYLPANCRFFYTKEMIFGPATVWQRAVDATWTNPARFCVEGSRMTVNATGIEDPFFRQALRENAGARTAGAAAGGLWVSVAFVIGLVAWL